MRGDPKTVETSLLDYWSVILRRRWVVYLAVASSFTIALFLSFVATPKYRATTTLLIDRQTPDIFTFKELGRTDYSWAAYSDFYQTQYKILASDAIARRAARRAHITSHPGFEDRSGRPGLLARLRSLLPDRKRVRESDPEDSAAAFVRAHTEIAPVRNSQLVKVSWVSPDPDLAARMANAISDAYIQNDIESKFSTSDQATEFLVDQIGTLKREIASIEERLQSYGLKKRIVSVDDSNNITLQALSDVSRRRTVAQTVLAETAATYRAVRESPPEALPEVRNSHLIAALKADYADAEAQYSEMVGAFKPDWPELQALRARMDGIRERLDSETREIAQQVVVAAKSDHLRARTEVENLDRLLGEQEDAAQTLRRDAVEFTNLLSEVHEKRETLNALIARQNETALSARLKDLDTTSSHVRVVDPARPPARPFRPRTRFNLVAGLLIGLALGVGGAFVLDHLDNSIKSPTEIETATSLPVLAVIPRHRTGPTALSAIQRSDRTSGGEDVELIVHRDSRSVTSEAYRDLRTAILLSSAARPPRLMMVSSALPSEGKTATAVNLAVAMAKLDRRVLLADADLRRPRLHRVFDNPERQGVSTFLTGMEDDLALLVQSTPVPGLDLLCSGPIPPNPSELLNSERFVEMTRRLLELGYDHVLFDTPPSLSVSDPVILSRAVEALIVVVRAGSTPRQSMVQAVDRFLQTGVTPIGIVLNDRRPERHGYGSYRYGHAAYGEPHEKPATGRRSGRAAGA